MRGLPPFPAPEVRSHRCSHTRCAGLACDGLTHVQRAGLALMHCPISGLIWESRLRGSRFIMAKPKLQLVPPATKNGTCESPVTDAPQKRRPSRARASAARGDRAADRRGPRATAIAVVCSAMLHVAYRSRPARIGGNPSDFRNRSLRAQLRFTPDGREGGLRRTTLP